MPPTIGRIIRTVAVAHGVTLNEMRSYRRNKATVTARHTAMWLTRQILPHSLPAIGRAFDRDHTTVLYGVSRVEQRMATESKFARQVHVLAIAIGRPLTVATLGEEMIPAAAESFGTTPEAILAALEPLRDALVRAFAMARWPQRVAVPTPRTVAQAAALDCFVTALRLDLPGLVVELVPSGIARPEPEPDDEVA